MKKTERDHGRKVKYRNYKGIIQFDRLQPCQTVVFFYLLITIEFQIIF